MKQEMLNNLMIHKEHIVSILNSDPHRCTFLDHLLLATNGWVWLGGCGFDLTTLKELAPGL